MKLKLNWMKWMGAGSIALAACGLSARSLAFPTEALADSDSTGNAGLIQVNGYGQASAEPEIVRIGVRIISRCNESSVAAKNANAVLANQVIDLLKKYAPEDSANDPAFRIIASPGANIRQTESEGYGEHLKIICEQKWRASEWISVAMKKLDSLPALQDDLLLAVDAAATVGIAQTWAEIDAPIFDLLPATWERIKAEAQANALASARKKFAIFDSACTFTGMRLIKASDPKFTEARVYDKVAYARASSETPVMPNLIEVSSSWDFVWAYDKASTSGGARCLY